MKFLSRRERFIFLKAGHRMESTNEQKNAKRSSWCSETQRGVGWGKGRKRRLKGLGAVLRKERRTSTPAFSHQDSRLYSALPLFLPTPSSTSSIQKNSSVLPLSPFSFVLSAFGALSSLISGNGRRSHTFYRSGSRTQHLRRAGIAHKRDKTRISLSRRPLHGEANTTKPCHSVVDQFVEFMKVRSTTHVVELLRRLLPSRFRLDLSPIFVHLLPSCEDKLLR